MASYFTKIDNRLLEALYRMDWNGSEFRVVLYLIRQTAGYHADEYLFDFMTITMQTSIPYGTMPRILRGLKEKKIITSCGKNDYHFRLSDLTGILFKNDSQNCQPYTLYKENIKEIKEKENTKNEEYI